LFPIFVGGARGRLGEEGGTKSLSDITKRTLGESTPDWVKGNAEGKKRIRVNCPIKILFGVRVTSSSKTVRGGGKTPS